MTNVRVYRMPKSAVRAEMLQLLKEAGCVIVEEDEEWVVLIVLLDVELLEDANLKVALLAAAHEKCRIIGVWPKGSTTGAMPEGFEDYCADTVIWDPVRLRAAVSGKQPQHDAPTGKPANYPRTSRNKCC
jgi:hypothetical protein